MGQLYEAKANNSGEFLEAAERTPIRAAGSNASFGNPLRRQFGDPLQRHICGVYLLLFFVIFVLCCW